MSIGVVRNLGSVENKPKMLSQLDTLIKTFPSNTAFASSTKRTFSKNSIVEHMAGDNYYSSNSGALVSTSGNVATITGLNGYSVAFATNCEAGNQYTLTHTLENGSVMRIVFYSADGTFINSVESTSNVINISVPINAKYTLLLPYKNGSFTWTFKSLV